MIGSAQPTTDALIRRNRFIHKGIASTLVRLESEHSQEPLLVLAERYDAPIVCAVIAMDSGGAMTPWILEQLDAARTQITAAHTETDNARLIFAVEPLTGWEGASADAAHGVRSSIAADLSSLVESLEWALTHVNEQCDEVAAAPEPISLLPLTVPQWWEVGRAS